MLLSPPPVTAALLQYRLDETTELNRTVAVAIQPGGARVWLVVDEEPDRQAMSVP